MGRLFLLNGIVVWLAAPCLWGQTNIPYSRYGIGAIQDPSGAHLRAWASPAAAFQNAYSSTFLNPASYAHLQVTTLEANLYQKALAVSTSADSSSTFLDGGLASLSFSFPLIRSRWGFSLGLMPFSRVGYNLLQRNDSVAGIGLSHNQFQGSGGTNLFYLGSGGRIGNFSIGINAAYVFGKLEYVSLLVFDDTLNAFNTQRTEEVVVGDLLFQGGLQQRFSLDQNDRHRLLLGISGNVGTDLRARRNLLYSRFTYGFGGIQLVEDTIQNWIGEEGSLRFPAMVQGSAIYSITGKLMAAATYQTGRWSDYRAFGALDSTRNNWKLALGVQFIPDVENFQSFWSQVAYRAGFSVGSSYWHLNGRQLYEQIFSIGVGFPVRKLLSEAAVSLEYHRLGSLATNPLAIRQYRITIGFLLSDRWFLKRLME
ncbi:MAG: hypothetical protein NZL95_00945 [Chitinophagales bacterium]|nr:hypothetical protein [Chitinophagales bacterium]MDW8427102.1 hypothetical protein [Chitinophagales bacterium]